MEGEADSVLSDDKGGPSLGEPSEVEHPAGSRRLRQDMSSVPNIPVFFRRRSRGHQLSTRKICIDAPV